MRRSNFPIYVVGYMPQGILPQVMKEVGVHPRGMNIMLPKGAFVRLLIRDLDPRQANIIKQSMLSIGGEAAVPMGFLDFTIERGDMLLTGTLTQMARLTDKLKLQPFGLKVLAEEIEEVLRGLPDSPLGGSRAFAMELPRRSGGKIVKRLRLRIIRIRPLRIGVINLTPDSFSGDGLAGMVDEAVSRAWSMRDHGADIVDVGGESSRPFSDPVTAEEELKRVMPFFETVGGSFPLPISIDTYKPSVAESTLREGASIVNDIYALRSRGMADLISKYKAGCVVMHMQGTPKNMQVSPKYERAAVEVADFLKDRLNFAEKKGIKREHLIVDPGIGFGKELSHNLELINRISYLFPLKAPILMGPSRKSFIGRITGRSVKRRVAGSIAASVMAYLMGADILRVHDVKETRDALDVASAIIHEGI